MQLLALFKVIKAALLFVREIWLRDRTFRQFVRENLSLIVTSFGFVIMTMFFLHVVGIVKDQEAQLVENEHSMAALKKQIESEIPFLKEKLEWYRDRYYELKAPKQPAKGNSPTAHKEPTPPPTPRPKPVEKPTINRPPSNDIQERWKRLSQ
ncbi:hypothetical protein PA10_00075 [Pseudomonas phage pPa_SNUABM_DT01]|nr:hypothetical protein PA10_00075 [Pseudomonas phage pPa_SNUABM_DT01]